QPASPADVAAPIPPRSAPFAEPFVNARQSPPLVKLEIPPLRPAPNAAPAPIRNPYNAAVCPRVAVVPLAAPNVNSASRVAAAPPVSIARPIAPPTAAPCAM